MNNEESNPIEPGNPASHADSSSPSGYSDEPFPCPHCGQMLAFTCRVCVACKQPVSPPAPRKLAAPPLPAIGHAAPAAGLLEPVRFPWPTFLAVLVALLAAALIIETLALPALGLQKTQILLGAIPFVISAWVLYDATRRGVPKPFRWAIGSLFPLVWIVIFPWYLARRRALERPCPFVEREISPLSRALLMFLIAFLLLTAILYVVLGPKK